MDRAGRSGLRAPAELSIAVVLLLELPMDVTEVAKLLEGGGGQKVVHDVQHDVRPPLQLVLAGASRSETRRYQCHEQFF